jgi:ribonuclease HII
VHRLSLADLRKRYVVDKRALPSAIERALAKDPRRGAREILEAVARRRRESRAEGQRLRHLLRFETVLWRRGTLLVAGVDEAGMSPLAGPVTAAAVILKPGWRAVGIDDSKKVDPALRRELAERIRGEAVSWAIAFAEHEEIDEINIYWAGLLAMRRAVEALIPTPEHLLIDARRLRDIALPQDSIVHGDARSLSIAAASILAKTARDARMVELDGRFPGYGLARHKGYPVREHLRALERLGPCPIHRRSFGPVRRALGLAELDDATNTEPSLP